MSALKEAWPAFTALANAMGGKYQYLANGDLRYFSHFDVIEGGVVVRVHVEMGGRGGITHVEVTARLRSLVISTPVLVRKEYDLDQLGKRLSIDRELQTGDARFDAAVYIESDAADADVLRMFGDARVREAVMAVTDMPCTQQLVFAADEQMAEDRSNTPLRLRLPPSALEDVAVMRKAVSGLAAVVMAFDVLLATAGPYRAGAPVQEAPPRPMRTGRGMLALLVVLGSLFGNCAMPTQAPTFGWLAVGIGVAFGLVLWALLLVPFGLLFRGRSSSFGNVIALMLGCLGVVPLGTRAVQLGNAWADQGAPETRVARGRYVSRKNGGDAELTATWLAGSPSVRIDARALGLKAGEYDVPVEVVVKPGLLGAPWLVWARRR
jgi:hypothetical protein